MKIAYARKNFEYLHRDYDDLEYRVVQSIDELTKDVVKISDSHYWLSDCVN